MTICCKMESPIGVLALVEKEETLKEIRFGGEIHQGEEERETPFCEERQENCGNIFRGHGGNFRFLWRRKELNFRKRCGKRSRQSLMEKPEVTGK